MISTDYSHNFGYRVFTPQGAAKTSCRSYCGSMGIHGTAEEARQYAIRFKKFASITRSLKNESFEIWRVFLGRLKDSTDPMETVPLLIYTHKPE